MSEPTAKPTVDLAKFESAVRANPEDAAPEYEFHSLADLFPMISEDELSELTADIKKQGLLETITLFEGKILDGRNRYKAAKAADVVLKNYHFKQLGDRNAEAFVISANIRRRHLTTKQKQGLLAKLIKADPAASDRSIADVAKVSHHTVGAVREGMEARGQIAHVETRTDSTGRKQPAAKAKGEKKSKAAESKAKAMAAALEKPATSFTNHLELMIEALKAFKSHEHAE
jgi:ParB-like chromosome segregation protein Spo0J